MTTTQFFGERWDAPRVDHATQVDTPEGQRCLHCTQPIEPGDRGLLMSYVSDIIEGKTIGGIAPVHMECDLRMSTGNVDHLEGRCTCASAPTTGSVPGIVAKTLREEALEVLEWFNTRRIARGMGPI